nr:MAG TPA: hypothetical protein [Caudoviricetes sp.]
MTCPIWTHNKIAARCWHTGRLTQKTQPKQ